MQLKLLKLLLSVSLANAQMIGYAVPAANYFVDGQHGSDSNSGRTPGSAFATGAHAMSVVSTGQLVAIAGGQTYREQVTIPASNIGVVGYNGKPVLDASSVITTGCVVDGTFANVYNVTVTTANSSTGFLWPFEDGLGMIEAASKSALNSASSGYFIANNGSLSGTSQTLSLHATGDGNPCSNGRIYEYNGRTDGLISQFTGTLVAHIQTQHNYGNNGSLEIRGYSQAFDIIAKYGTKHNFYMSGGSVCTDCTFQDSYYNSSKILGVLNQDSPNGESASFINPTCIEGFQSSTCLYGHTNLSGGFGLVTVKNIHTSGIIDAAVNGFVGTDMLIDGGVVNGSISVGSSNTNVIRNLTMTSHIAIPFSVPVEIDTVTISCACVTGLVTISSSISPTIYIHNSDFSNSIAFDGAIYVSVGATVAGFTMLNNIFRAPVQTNHLQGSGLSNMPTSTINGNTYHYPGASSWISWLSHQGGTAYDISTAPGWAAWQALGFDATGSRVTP